MELAGGWDAQPPLLAASMSTAAAQPTDDSLWSSPEAASVLGTFRVLGIPG